MIEKLFSFDGWYYRTFTFAANLIILNLLFLTTAWTLVLTGPSLIALYQSVDRLLKEQGNSVFRDYYRLLAANLKRGTILVATLLSMAAVLAGIIYLLMGVSTSLGFLAVVIAALTLLFLAVLTVVYSVLPLPFKSALRESSYVLLASTAHGIILLALPVMVAAVLIKVNLMLYVIVGFAVTIWLQLLFFNKVLVDKTNE
ncbi:DUF624 domain-containing protein [Candidatus Enterococcus leclercqii]|uniref:DUF624 domain-containing protein n=1 Tax=Enterococcus TaxID=1350 RepID=UPI00137963FA|nr:DUF624 domain-containing protein [Enterococcus sp. CU9D]